METHTKSTGQGSNGMEQTKTDLQRTNNDSEYLKQQEEKDLQRLQDESSRLTTEVKDPKTQTKNLETSLSEFRKTGNESVKQTLKQRQRTSNRETENINERCRPSVIAEKYYMLESQEWLYAKENLEKISGQDEEEILRFLCEALMASYETSLDIYQNLELAIAELLRNPTLAMDITKHIARDLPKLPEEIIDAIRFELRQTVQHINTEGIPEVSYETSLDIDQNLELAIAELLRNPTLAMDITRDAAKDLPKLPEEMTYGIRFQLRQTVEHINTEAFFKIVKSSISTKFRDKSVNQFLQEMFRLTWQMVIQQPPMTLSIQDSTFDDEKHRLWWSCDQSHGKTIDYFIWPVLKDYEDGAVMVKGYVYVSINYASVFLKIHQENTGSKKLLDNLIFN